MTKTLGRIATVTDFLAKAVKAIPSRDSSAFVAGILQAMPWLEQGGNALAQMVPPVKFVVDLAERFAYGDDVDKLGHLACTTAYQQAIVQEIGARGRPATAPPQVATEDVQRQLEKVKTEAGHDFQNFSFETALTHPFIHDADQVLRQFAQKAGYDEKEINAITGGVHQRFLVNLQRLLHQRDQKKHFAPWTGYLRESAGEYAAYQFLVQHADLQRRLFEEAPVLGREPFALKDVYIHTQCGVLTWDEIQGGEKQGGHREGKDPFLEKNGGRHDLLETLLTFLADPKFREALVIQGPAGSGKSSFTLRLCAALVERGLRPLRICMKHLACDPRTHVLEDLARAVHRWDPALDEQPPQTSPPADLFRNGAIFNESLRFGTARICPYILILDGWDEIDIGASSDFKAHLGDFLKRLRYELLGHREIPVRVVLTGRPTVAVGETGFLKRETPLLTLRPILPAALETFVGDLARNLKRKPVREDWEPWALKNVTRFDPVFKVYRQAFEESKKRKEQGQANRSDTLDVLGQPLLALLALRLMAVHQGNLAELVQNPTSLYRQLVDLTCVKSGKAPGDSDDPGRMPRFSGHHLRRLLHATAAAITINGGESVPREELSYRLDSLEPKWRGRDMDADIRDGEQDHGLVRLMVSYFFKTGHKELGCEFLHKSFKEYLFAEAILARLKAYDPPETLSPPKDARREFPAEDPRHHLCLGLTSLLAPQWLTAEVWGHLERLLVWEIERAWGQTTEGDPNLETPKLKKARWWAIRDALADIWAWWVAGAHQRAQVQRGKLGQSQTSPAYVNDLAEWCLPRQRQGKDLPPRFTRVDAHLGDGLCQLTALCHFFIARAEGWIFDDKGERLRPDGLWQGLQEPDPDGPYQSQVVREGVIYRLFRPGGMGAATFLAAIGRINGVEDRRPGQFPSGAFLQGCDFTKHFLVGILAKEAKMSYASLDNANLYHASLDYASLDYARLDYASLVNARLYHASLDHASLDHAILDYASLDHASLHNASLDHASLYHASLDYARMFKATANKGTLIGCSLKKTRIRDCRFLDADFTGADFAGAEIDDADFTGAKISEDQLAAAAHCKNLTGLPWLQTKSEAKPEPS